MNILMITQYFEPETFRGNDIAYYFARMGMNVTVICGTPNYPQGNFFTGYGWFKRNREIINKVKVIRLPIIPRGNGSKLKLLANYFSYFIIASIFLPFHILLNKRYDACFVQQLSPVMMSVPGVIFKKLTGRKLYTWVLDLWPESLKAAGEINNSKILGFFNWFAKLEYKHSDKILVSSNGFATNIASKGDFASKILYMPNWAEDELNTLEELEIPDFPSGFNVVFAGNIGEAQDFDSVIEAAKLLKSEDNIHFIIVGDGRRKKWVNEQIIKFGLSDRMLLLGRYDIKYMPSFFKKADCLFLSLKDDEILNLTVPAKLQAYMTNAKPIVAMINGDANKLIKETDCGISIPASCPEELVAALRTLKDCSVERLQQMGNNAKSYCEENFNKEKILKTLYDLMSV